MKKSLFKTEKAEVMVEASLILSIAVIIIFMLLYLGLIMYHQTLITATANQAATNIAQVYSNKYKDPISGFVDVSNLDREGIVIKMKSEEYANTIKTQAEWYSKYRMAKGEILSSDEPEVTVRIENKKGSLLRAQVVVDVEQTYKLPFIKMFGVDNPEIKYEAEGRADCSEIMDYVNIIEAADKIDVTENFTVKFLQKDRSVYKTVEVMHDMSIAETSKISKAEKTRFPADPTWPNERFYRWKTATEETFTKDTIVTGNIEVLAEYEIKVHFDPNGGTVNPNMKFVPDGHAIGSMPTPSRQNYSFDGWYTGKNNGTKYLSSTIVNGEITLYAHWKCMHSSTRTEDSGIICQGTGKRKIICNICGAVLSEQRLYGEHYILPCDKSHNLGKYVISPAGHTRSYGYQYTTIGRCRICKYCKQRFDGYWCVQHYDNDGLVNDNYWKNWETIPCNR